MFKVGFIQFHPVRKDPAHNLAEIKRLCEGVKADLLVLPELANSGYMYASRHELVTYTEPGDGSGLFLDGLMQMARSMRTVFVTGFAENTHEHLFNSAAAVSSQGILQVYRKTHLFNTEKLLFDPGDTGYVSFMTYDVVVGMMVCFDWIFPEAARTLALQEAQIIAHPSNLVLPYCQRAMVTRSLENRVFTITANRYGSEELEGSRLTFTGESQVLDISGNLLAQAPVEGDCVKVVEIDPFLADNKAMNAHNDLFLDRRPGFYSL